MVTGAQHTVDAYLSPLSTSLSPTLVPPDSLQRIRRVARSLPFGLTDFFGFECRLGESRAPTDVLFAVLRRQVPELIHCDPSWRSLRDFARSWSDPTGVLHDRVANIWLEFDTEQVPASGAVAPPNIFLATKEIPGPDRRMPSWCVDTALGVLRGGGLASAERTTLQHCVEQLPAPARVFQVGSMLARPGSGTRICVRDIDARQILRYLHTIGRPDDDGALSGLLDEFAPLVDAVDLDIDIGEHVGPKVGLELRYEPRDVPLARLGALFARLVALGVCSQAQQEALSAYPGTLVPTGACAAQWPPPLVEMSRLLGGRAAGVLRRAVHHVKLVHEPGRPISAKAYLEVHLDWLVRSGAELSLVAPAP